MAGSRGLIAGFVGLSAGTYGLFARSSGRLTGRFGVVEPSKTAEITDKTQGRLRNSHENKGKE